MSDWLMANAVLWPVLAPIATAGLTALLWNFGKVQRAISYSGALLTFAAGLYLLRHVDADGVVELAQYNVRAKGQKVTAAVEIAFDGTPTRVNKV